MTFATIAVRGGDVESQGEQFELRGPDAEAIGFFTEEGFWVRAGSLARKNTTPSGRKIGNQHSLLVQQGVLVEESGQFRFVKDHPFATPSGAAAVVLGRTANGWQSWKRADGKTLSEVKRIARSHSQNLLDETIRSNIKERYQQLLNEGKLPTLEQLDKEYALFRERFGPSALQSLDGEELLSYMHDLRRTNRGSLVYWLEFKNDEEFQTRRLGSISGGSALKYRIFQRKETGSWQAGGKGNKPEDITLEEAIDYARSHRDQLVRGCEALESMPEPASDEDYAGLQDQLDDVAPDVSRLAWGHKYFSLLFPGRLDDYHNPEYQRFHLLKMLIMPPEGDGRYLCAGRFVDAAKELGLCMNHFTTTLNSLHGRPHQYWRIGTTAGTSGESQWPMMQEKNCIAIGWGEVGDLSWIDGKRESLEQLKSRLSSNRLTDPRAIGREASQIAQFAINIEEGDIVLAAEGMRILGIGKVLGGYEYQPGFSFPHQRKVEWLTTESWQLPQSSEGLQSTVRSLGKWNENLFAIEERIQSQPASQHPKETRVHVSGRTARLNGIAGRIQSVLERKSQVVLYGPPGTGKTYWAERTANELAALSTFNCPFDELEEAQRESIVGGEGNAGLVRICCFHPAYGYEDFLEGYRPRTINGNVSFDLRDGIFKQLCKDAESSPDRQFFLIIDEINRGDIPRIFGELLTALEKDKRGKRVVLPVSQEVFSVPRNVFLIGTMNTADRSISLMDAALRRRFGWVELMPDSSVLKDSLVAGIALRAWLDALNTRIREHVGRDARNLQIGHSYLMQGGAPIRDLATLKRAIRDEIIPLLEEYCYEDFGALANILGDQLVDQQAQQIRVDIFDDGQEDAFVQGILAPFAEISTCSDAILPEGLHPDLDDDDGDES